MREGSGVLETYIREEQAEDRQASGLGEAKDSGAGYPIRRAYWGL